MCDAHFYYHYELLCQQVFERVPNSWAQNTKTTLYYVDSIDKHSMAQIFPSLAKNKERERENRQIQPNHRITSIVSVFASMCEWAWILCARCRIHLAGASERLNKSFEITHTHSHTWNKLLFRNVFERIYGIFCNVCFYFCDINLLIEEFSTEFMSNMATCIPMKAPTLRFSSPLSFLSLDKVYVLFDPQQSQRSERTNKANDSHFRNKRCESEMP